MRKFNLHNKAEKIEPTNEQVARNKDFKRLYHEYELVTKRGKHPLFRDKKRLLLWILIAIIFFLLFSM